MPKDFLGKGWGFPVRVGPGGALPLAEYEERVRQSIWIILGTAKGERVMLPDFGCGIYDLVFSPNTPETAGSVATAVRQALLLYEPRVSVLDVRVRPENGGQVLLVVVDYEVRATNNVFNLVYPFYLERSRT
ncbi:MAG TPA: GPW/gp25 family protein [Pyrinomonadaceae bacterium]|nr:GPW/gp25 family protein [Pyrinomonadaceae bacterium]